MAQRIGKHRLLRNGWLCHHNFLKKKDQQHNQRIIRGEAMGLSPPSDYDVLKDRKSQDFLRLQNLVDFDNGNISMRRSSSVSCIPM